MSATIAFNKATDKEPVPCVGRSLWIDVGGSKRRFVAHDGTLSDYASGYRIASLHRIAISEMVRYGHNHRTTVREQSEALIASLVSRLGAEKLLSVFNAKPVINR